MEFDTPLEWKHFRFPRPAHPIVKEMRLCRHGTAAHLQTSCDAATQVEWELLVAMRLALWVDSRNYWTNQLRQR